MRSQETGLHEIKKAESENQRIPISRQEPGEKLVESLNGLLADEFAVFTKTLNYHWNIEGPRFHSLHNFLEEQYRELLEIVDDVAERNRKIGAHANGTMQEFLRDTQVKERAGFEPESYDMIADLVSDHEKVQSRIRETLLEVDGGEDPGTEDFLVGLLKQHEEMTWMLKSHLAS